MNILRNKEKNYFIIESIHSKKYRDKLTKIKKILIDNDIYFSKEIDSVVFDLLTFNKVTSNMLRFYQEIRKQFTKFLLDNKNLEEKYDFLLNDIERLLISAVRLLLIIYCGIDAKYES